MTSTAKCPWCGRDADFVETHGGARSCYHPLHDATVAHGEGGGVALWAYRKRNGDFMYDSNKIDDLDVEMRALPVAAYNALLARANTAKVAADLMRARAERAEALLKECREKLGAILNLAECYGRKRGDKEDAVAARAFLSRLDDALGGA